MLLLLHWNRAFTLAPVQFHVYTVVHVYPVQFCNTSAPWHFSPAPPPATVQQQDWSSQQTWCGFLSIGANLPLAQLSHFYCRSTISRPGVLEAQKASRILLKGRTARSTGRRKLMTKSLSKDWRASSKPENRNEAWMFLWSQHNVENTTANRTVLRC